MNKARDNKIARDIIAGKINELYCIKEGYNGNIDRFTLSRKYKIFVNFQTKTDLDGEVIKIYKYYILDNFNNRIRLEKNTSISDYFEISFKEVRKLKIKKINSYGHNLSK
jgi:hypothetical protein